MAKWKNSKWFISDIVKCIIDAVAWPLVDRFDSLILLGTIGFALDLKL